MTIEEIFSEYEVANAQVKRELNAANFVKDTISREL
jgi:hypothetical protein